MEMKSFNKITKQILTNYGFTKTKEYYILELKDITFFVWVDSWRGLKSFMYYLSINALHNEGEAFEEKIDICHSNILNHNTNPKGSHQHELHIAEWTETQYREILRKLLCEYFEPYKQKGLQYLKDIGHTLSFTQKAQMFLFSASDININIKAQMLRYYSEDSAYIALKGYVLSKTKDVNMKVRITTNNAEFFTDENGNQDIIFYNDKDSFEKIKIGDEIKFFTTRFRFYNSLYPVISLLNGERITYSMAYPYLIEGKKKYIEWIEQTFPIKTTNQ